MGYPHRHGTLPTSGGGRFADIDLVKTVAILCVICIHVCAPCYQRPLGSLDWMGGLFWGSLTRAGVPLFFMCSGALMLDPERELGVKELYSRKILRLVLALFFWAFAYKVFRLAVAGALDGPSLLTAIKELLLFRHEQHLYFLHIILLVYACLPVTRVFVKNADEKQFRYFLALWFAAGILYPTLRPFWPFRLLGGIPAQWLLNMTWASVGYGVLGYYLRMQPLPRRFAAAAAVGGWLSVFGGTYLMSMRSGASYFGFFEGMSAGVCLLAAGVFALCVGATSKNVRFISYIGKASFCMYLTHIFFLDAFAYCGFSALTLPCFIAVPLVTLTVASVSAALYLVLSRIPVMKDWLL